MRIKNKFKFIRAILILLFILSVLFCKTTFSYKEIEYITYYVEEGDTLWSIAKELSMKNSYYKNTDIREIIDEIRSINNLHSGNIFVNQALLVSV